ncbi:MAG: PKD domain-containing protein [Bacteroidales bacterium]
MRITNCLQNVKLLVLLAFLIPIGVQAQGLLRKALFLGNSYTYVNNLPAIVAALAQASGDTLYFESNSPGGYTFGWQPIAHAADPVSLAKMAGNNWDFVILQEQSQTPAIGRLRDSCMYPASHILYDSVKAANPCSRVLFFLTWGRRFGGIQCFTPNYCSPDFTGFDQMQDSLTLAYKGIADSLDAWIAPVGEAWRFVISHTGMVLHDADDSHPNLKGSYLSACVFYAVMFGKHAAGNGYTAGIPPDSALVLQKAADSVTFGYAGSWNLNNDVPYAKFSLATTGNTLVTTNLSMGGSAWHWDFGDGAFSGLFEPVHIYAFPGVYNVKLQTCNDCFCDSVSGSITISITAVSDHGIEPGTICLAGTDGKGDLHLTNYPGDGMLRFYDLTGRATGSSGVEGGIIGHLPSISGFSIWILEDDSGNTMARGKISF